jgi:hypothetical protein
MKFCLKYLGINDKWALLKRFNYEENHDRLNHLRGSVPNIQIILSYYLYEIVSGFYV